MCESVSQKCKPVKQMRKPDSQMCKPVSQMRMPDSQMRKPFFQQATAVVPAMQIWSNKTEIMIKNRKI